MFNNKERYNIDLNKNEITTVGQNINNYISQLTRWKKPPKNELDFETMKRNESLEKAIQVVVYMRDKLGAETYEDILELLKDRKVDPKIVGLWLEEGMVRVSGELDAIMDGYPEFRKETDKIEDDFKRRLKELVKNFKALEDFFNSL